MSDSIERQAAHFDGIAETYRSAREDRNHRALKALMWGDFFRDKAFLKKDDLSVLEPMCGFADGRRVLSQHLQAKFEYRGFDYSAAVVKQLKHMEPGISVAHQDVAQFRANREFDLIMLLGGLHHVPHVAGDVVRRLTMGLRPGGHFISLEPTDGNAVFTWVRRLIYRSNALFDETTERSFNRREYHALFEAAGLECVERTYPGLLAYVLYYNPDAFPFLNIGGTGLVRRIWRMETPFRHGRLGRTLSFATLSLWRKPGGG
jgi:SAM-dependent methyltransferase